MWFCWPCQLTCVDRISPRQYINFMMSVFSLHFNYGIRSHHRDYNTINVTTCYCIQIDNIATCTMTSTVSSSSLKSGSDYKVKQNMI